MFEQATAAAGARILAPELFFKQLVTVHDSNASFYLRFRRVTAASFTHRFEKRNLRVCRRACWNSFVDRVAGSDRAHNAAMYVVDRNDVRCVHGFGREKRARGLGVVSVDV